MSIKQGKNIIAGSIEPSGTHFIGEWVLIATSNDIVPEGCVKPDGFEQLDAPNSMFADLWNYCLRPSLDWDNKTYLDTCTYEEYDKFIKEYGACPKWGVNYAKNSFRVPFIPDGYYIKQGQGTVNKAGLPNITGEFELATVGYWEGGEGDRSSSGAFYLDKGTKRGPQGSGSTDIKTHFDASRSNPIYGTSDTVETDAIGLRLFIYVANGAIGDFNVNWNKIQSALATKLNSSLNNMPSNNDIVIDYEVNSDGSWYRKYKSGWLEQGGSMYYEANSNTKQVIFLKPYKNTNYTITNSVKDYQWQGVKAAMSLINITTTGFTIYNYGNDGYGTCIWYACGQGA